MKVKIDRSGCISCGVCASTCPAVFRMAEDGLAEVYNEAAAQTDNNVAAARDNCPVSVIVTENE